MATPNWVLPRMTLPARSSPMMLPEDAVSRDTGPDHVHAISAVAGDDVAHARAPPIVLLLAPLDDLDAVRAVGQLGVARRVRADEGPRDRVVGGAGAGR